ncbi:MAG: Methyltransferase domain [Chloroflexota bacterium]|nr:Methyltransferase domain [Chloroflexota bacterium]
MWTVDRVRTGPLLERYSQQDLAAISVDDRRHLLIDGSADPQRDPSLAWELLYRLEPKLYDRLVTAERLHPAIVRWLPNRVERIVEIGAGSGRLTLELVSRCNRLTAIEPAAPLREILTRKLGPVAAHGTGGHQPASVRVIGGFLDALPVADRSAELVVACSVLTPEPSHGGDPGLAEMERVCATQGMVLIIWPNHPEWLLAHGYRYLSFAGDMAMEFASITEAIELARIFYPQAVDAIRRVGDRHVPYEILGVNPPRDLAYKTIP